ncbi:MAG: hypothetical protein KDA36_13425, partial [Planctomycetaceae bacterium]|nr:hypothetical protein [Planctomycetaceae bacterium]
LAQKASVYFMDEPMAGVDAGTERIIFEVRTFTAKYRDGSGQVVVRPTECKDETAARWMLADWERRAELVKSNVVSAAEDAIFDHQRVPLKDQIELYIEHQTGKGLNLDRIKSTRQRLNRIADDCSFRFLPDLKGESLKRWLLDQQREKMSAGSRNGYRDAIVRFANWCVRTRRFLVNPFQNIPKADNRSDCRRKRRALTEDELLKLLDVARRRPLLDASTIRRGRQKGQTVANLRPEVVHQLDRLGWERALIYKTLVLTGLRLNELRTLMIGQLVLDGDFPCLTLDAADEKNRQGNTLPLLSDLAQELGKWIESEKERLSGAAGVAKG